MKGLTPFVYPVCGGNEATQRVSIIYHKNFDGSDNKDVIDACHECAERLKADAIGHGYTVNIHDLRTDL